jgi:hypothetical protein
MQTIQGHSLTTLRSVQAFLADRAEQLPEAANSGARRKLDEIIAQLSLYITEQAEGTRNAQGATQRQHALRQALVRLHIAPLVCIARAELAHTAELEPFRMPRGMPPVEKLAAAAYGMAMVAARHASVFIAAGLPHDFVEQLTRTADALVGSVSERTQHRSAVGGATTGIRKRLVAGGRIVRVLDTFVLRDAHDDPALLAGWDSVRQVRRVGGRRAHFALPAGAEPHRIAAAASRLLAAQTTTGADERALPPARNAMRLLEGTVEVSVPSD